MAWQWWQYALLSLGYKHCTHFDDNTVDAQDPNTHVHDDEEGDEDGNEDEADDMVEVTCKSQQPAAADGQTTQSTAQSGEREWDKEYEIEAFLLNTAGMPMETNTATTTDYGIYV